MMSTHVLRLLLTLTVIAVTQSGCFWFTSKDDGETLRKEMVLLQKRIETLESEQAEKQAHLTEMIARARGEVDKLEETLTKATRILSRNSADFGADMENVKQRLRQIDGILAEMKHDVDQTNASMADVDKKVKEFAMAAGIDMPVDSSTVPNDPQKHLDMIRNAFGAGKYSETRSLSSLFLKRHPRHKSADVAQLHIARSFVAQKRWAKALGALRTFTDSYPKSANTPEALYEMARSFFSLGDCTDARILIDALTSRHSKSEYAKKALQLKELMKKNKARCTS